MILRNYRIGKGKKYQKNKYGVQKNKNYDILILE